MRWLDLGHLNPQQLHAGYQGIAEAVTTESDPILIWATTDSHISLGASQSALGDLDIAQCEKLDIPIVQRCLGGGSVLVDEQQYCFFFIFPTCNSVRGTRIYQLVMPIVQQAYRSVGLAVEHVGDSDLWYQGRKILGSGAATVNRASIWGGSFLSQFNSELFALCVSAPGEEYRHWLANELADSMTSIDEAMAKASVPVGKVPIESQLKQALRDAVEEFMQVRLQDSKITEAEQLCVTEALDEVDCDDYLQPGAKYVRNGIKINHDTYLFEAPVEIETDSVSLGWVRFVLKQGRISQIAASHDEQLLQSLIGVDADKERLGKALAERTDSQNAQFWSETISAICADVWSRVYA